MGRDVTAVKRWCEGKRSEREVIRGWPVGGRRRKAAVVCDVCVNEQSVRGQERADGTDQIRSAGEIGGRAAGVGRAAARNVPESGSKQDQKEEEG